MDDKPNAYIDKVEQELSSLDKYIQSDATSLDILSYYIKIYDSLENLIVDANLKYSYLYFKYMIQVISFIRNCDGEINIHDIELLKKLFNNHFRIFLLEKNNSLNSIIYSKINLKTNNSLKKYQDSIYSTNLLSMFRKDNEYSNLSILLNQYFKDDCPDIKVQNNVIDILNICLKCLNNIVCIHSNKSSVNIDNEYIYISIKYININIDYESIWSNMLRCNIYDKDTISQLSAKDAIHYLCLDEYHDEKRYLYQIRKISFLLSTIFGKVQYNDENNEIIFMFKSNYVSKCIDVKYKDEFYFMQNWQIKDVLANDNIEYPYFMKLSDNEIIYIKSIEKKSVLISNILDTKIGTYGDKIMQVLNINE